MNQQEIARLAQLQDLEKKHLLNIVQAEELRVLRYKLAVLEEEKPDDPSTIFTDESRSPNISDDGDYREQQRKRDADEFFALVEKYTLKYGKEALGVLISALLKKF